MVIRLGRTRPRSSGAEFNWRAAADIPGGSAIAGGIQTSPPEHNVREGPVRKYMLQKKKKEKKKYSGARI